MEKMLSVVIPTYNKINRLKLTLASIDKQKLDRERYEIIIVNDGSTDGTMEYLENRKTEWNLKLINQQNQGRSAARNAGVLAAKGEFILFSDDDCIMRPDFLSNHYNQQLACPQVLHGRIVTLTQMKFFDDPSKGTLCMEAGTTNKKRLEKYIITEEDIKQDFQNKVASNSRLNTLEKCIKELYASKVEQLYWIGFTGGNVSMPLEWLINVGMFNNSFGIEWGCEDLELGYRMFQMGYKFAYCDEAVNYHIAHARNNFEEEVEVSFKKFEALHDDKNIAYLKEFLLGVRNVEGLLGMK